MSHQPFADNIISFKLTMYCRKKTHKCILSYIKLVIMAIKILQKQNPNQKLKSNLACWISETSASKDQ